MGRQVTGQLTGLLDATRQPGVYRVLGEPARIVAALQGAGWTTAMVGATETRTDFYREIATALQLPDYFGANLDALWDVLSELSEPTALVFERWTDLARARPEGWRRILDVLTERTELRPPFAVVLA